jgi:O-antigen biosynthesis protein
LQLSIIIVNYNVKFFLEQCLSSVIKACENITAQIIVVDNCSIDESESFFVNRFEDVEFIWGKKNIGFAKANNIALAKAKGEYILFLNPDTIVPEDCFLKCMSFLNANKNDGALGIKMVDGTGTFLKESKRSFPSPLTSFFKLSGLTSLFSKSKIFAKYYLGHLSNDKNHEVDVLAGAFMMVPKKILDTIGGFDETFFMYGEDVDLSYRIQQAGYKNYYFSESTIIHFKGESTKKGSLNYIKLFYQAMSIFVAKHYKGSSANLFSFIIQIAIVFRAILSVLGTLFFKIGLPFLDALVIFGSFWSTKIVWNTFIKKDIFYSPNLLLIALPIFSAIFIVSSYYTGLYDKGYKQSQLNKSTFVSALVLLVGYALLPEHARFSRGILIFGIVGAWIIMSVIRALLVHYKFIKKINNETLQTIVAGNKDDLKNITQLMEGVGMYEHVLANINYNNNNTNQFENDITLMVKKYNIMEIIFCENTLSFKNIITLIQSLPNGIKYKFFAKGSSSLIGSDGKDENGENIGVEKKYLIAQPINKRNKNLIDFTASLFFLISFPIHLFFQKKPLGFFKNICTVLILKKTWVGYASTNGNLPPIKKGIITSTCLPSNLNKDLQAESLLLSDEWYASSYNITTDLKKIWRGYTYLGN